MNWTFGISTNNTNNHLLVNLIESIKKLNIPNYEIIICGEYSYNDSNIIHIDFDETQREGWTTKKKNLMVQCSKYENLCILSDYFLFDSNWYKNFVEFGNDWDICQNKIINYEGERFSDWTLNHFFVKLFYQYNPHYLNIMNNLFPNNKPDGELLNGLPYDYNKLIKFQYISGGYIVCKRNILIEEPLDENRCYGDSEDIEWSMRVLTKYKVKMNKNSIVNIQKPKWKIDQIPDFLLKEMELFFDHVSY